MASDLEYWDYIKRLDRTGLRGLWDEIRADRQPADFVGASYDRGKAFEFLVIRGFELDLESAGRRSGKVVWPRPLSETDLALGDSSRTVEQVDGGVHVPGLSCLFECKCQTKDKVDVEPIAKLAFRVLRRPAGVIGSVFSVSGFTTPAEKLARFMAGVTVLLWYPEDVQWCLTHPDDGGFVEALQWKYRQAVDRGRPDLILSPLTAPGQAGDHSDRRPGD